MSGTIKVSGSSTSTLAGQRTFDPYELLNGNDVSETLIAVLNQGDNTFQIPTQAIGVVVIPPQVIPQALWTLRTNLNATAAGLPIPVACPTLYAFPGIAPDTTGTPPTSIIVNSSEAIENEVALWFW